MLASKLYSPTLREIPSGRGGSQSSVYVEGGNDA